MAGIPGTTTHISWTPLSFAKDAGYEDIAELLRQHGAKELVHDCRNIP
jgi:hypothetical protein